MIISGGLEPARINRNGQRANDGKDDDEHAKQQGSAPRAEPHGPMRVEVGGARNDQDEPVIDMTQRTRQDKRGAVPIEVFKPPLVIVTKPRANKKPNQRYAARLART